MSLWTWMTVGGMNARRYRRARGGASATSMCRVERLLRAQAASQATSAPPDLQYRIIESVQELQRGESRLIPAPAMTWRPFMGIAAAAGLAGIITAGVYIASPWLESAPEVVGPSPGPQVVTVETPRSLSLDPAPAIVPAGRLVVARFETPLRNEAELLRRDTQRATEIVLSHLPFGGGFR
jgi:hypothetical protein